MTPLRARGAGAAEAVKSRDGARLRLVRLAQGLSQQDLAVAAGVTRQAVAGVESGHWDPSLRVALALAGALGVQVEELFGPPPALASIAAVPLRAPEGGGRQRVELALVGTTTVALPLDGGRALRAGFAPAGGVRIDTTDPARRPWEVRPSAPLRPSVVVAGCDPALPLLAGPLGLLDPPFALSWWPCSSREALELAAAGLVHVAGFHVAEGHVAEDPVAEGHVAEGPVAEDPVAEDPVAEGPVAEGPVAGFHVAEGPVAEGPVARAPVPRSPVARRHGGVAGAVASRLAGHRGEVISFAVWAEGLASRPGLGVPDLAGVADRHLRLVNREPGSEARELLEADMRRNHLDAGDVVGFDAAAGGHLVVAAAVASGLGEVGITTEPSALAYGLDFLPLASERFLLMVPRTLLDTAEVRGLLRVLASPGLHDQLTALPGYRDVDGCGEVVASL